MTDLRILGLTGAAGAGKDTLANELESIAKEACRTGAVKRAGPHFRIYSMTAPINRMIDALLSRSTAYNRGNPFDMPPHWSSQEWKASTVDIGDGSVVIRDLQQKIGTEFGRLVVHPDIWLWAAQEAFASTSLRPDDIMVITNVRFENEATWVRKHGKVVEVVRPPSRTDQAIASVLNEGQRAHSSEAGLPRELIDATILNDGTEEDLGYRGAGLCRFLGFRF